MKKWMFSLVCIVTVIGLAATLWTQRTEMALLRDERTRLEQELAALRERASRPPKPEEKKMTTAEAAAIGAALVGGKRKETPEERNARIERMQNVDRKRVEAELGDARKVAILNQRTWVDLDIRYADLFRRLGLSTEQTDKLKQLMVERQLVRRETYALPGNALPGNLSPKAREELEARLLADVEAQIGTHLGEPVRAALVDYEQSEPARRRVTTIDRRLAYSGGPLVEQQQHQLTAVLRATPPPARPKANDPLPVRQAFVARLNEYNAGLVQSVAKFLSADQTAGLSKLLQEEVKIEELGLGK